MLKEADRTDEDAPEQTVTPPRAAAGPTIKVRTLAIGAGITCLVASSAFFAWQAHSKSQQVSALHSADADRAHAEQVALDYAVGAANMDFKDLNSWQTKLTANTTPDLSNKLKQAAGSMEQIITPLQWTSSSTPIVAKVRSESHGQFAVDCFVSVLTKNAQAPDGVQSTATYRLTIDKNANWVITEVGGIDSALTTK
ncbi:hypothetical protein [Nocardia sp. NPDC004123]